MKYKLRDFFLRSSRLAPYFEKNIQLLIIISVIIFIGLSLVDITTGIVTCSLTEVLIKSKD